MCVEREGRGRLRVPKLGGDVGDRGTLVQQVRREGVPKVVQAEPG